MYTALVQGHFLCPNNRSLIGIPIPDYFISYAPWITAQGPSLDQGYWSWATDLEQASKLTS